VFGAWLVAGGEYSVSASQNLDSRRWHIDAAHSAWPAGIEARGELRTTVGHVIDVTPTILKLAGGQWTADWNGKPRPTVPGRDLSVSFASDAQPDREFLWWLHQGNRAIREGDWKLVSTGDGPWELYDLKHDRMENHDLADKNSDKVRELGMRWSETTREFVELAKSQQ
jgi:arylsulfatase A-like enzyme